VRLSLSLQDGLHGVELDLLWWRIQIQSQTQARWSQTVQVQMGLLVRNRVPRGVGVRLVRRVNGQVVRWVSGQLARKVQGQPVRGGYVRAVWRSRVQLMTSVRSRLVKAVDRVLVVEMVRVQLL
jgi:hypothetical protein